MVLWLLCGLRVPQLLPARSPVHADGQIPQQQVPVVRMGGDPLLLLLLQGQDEPFNGHQEPDVLSVPHSDIL